MAAAVRRERCGRRGRVRRGGRGECGALRRRGGRVLRRLETPGAPLLDERQARLVVPIEDLLGHAARGTTVDERPGVGALPLDADDCGNGIREDAAEGRLRLKLFEFDEHPWAGVSCVVRYLLPPRGSSPRSRAEGMSRKGPFDRSHSHERGVASSSQATTRSGSESARGKRSRE